MYAVSMNILSEVKQVQVISALVEGNSIRATVRMSGVAKGTVIKLLERVGKACLEYQRNTFKNLDCKKIQCDEIWSFCYAKEKNVPKEKRGKFGFGDVWTWTAIDADSKLVPSWMIGDRSAKTAKLFMDDLSSRLKNRVQLNTDGHKAYLEAVEGAFGGNVDYGMRSSI